MLIASNSFVLPVKCTRNKVSFKYIPKSASLMVLAAWVLTCSMVQAAAGRANYDLDGDGLIEIQTLEDFLAIKDTFSSAKLYGENTGCANGRCVGYELTEDLDFGTLTNLSSTRTPISLYSMVFEGNGHSLKNINALITRTDYMGVFSSLNDSVVKNLVIENINLNNSSGLYTGALAGLVLRSKLVNVRATGVVGGYHYTGGLVGVANAVTMLGCHFSGVIKPAGIGSGLPKGGLIGSSQDTTLYASSSEGRFDVAGFPNPNYELGGLIGVAQGNEIVVASAARFANGNVNALGNFAADARMYIENSYSVFDEVAPNNKTAAVIRFYARAGTQKESQSYIQNLLPNELKCPKSTWSPNCSEPALLDGWDKYQDSVGQRIWDFGSAGEFPKIRADLMFELSDTDGDGIVDLVDRFPGQAAAAVDLDRDNKADFFAANCDQACQQKSDLVLDTGLNYTAPTSGTAQPAAGAIAWWQLFMVLLGAGFMVRSRQRRPSLFAPR